eukprot:826468-Rhodomonas_salina.1
MLFTLPQQPNCTAEETLACWAQVLVRWRSDRIGVVELRGLSLRDQTLPQFTQDEGEMKVRWPRPLCPKHSTRSITVRARTE